MYICVCLCLCLWIFSNSHFTNFRQAPSRSLHSRRINAIQSGQSFTRSFSDIKANGILLNRSKPTECSLRMHVNLGWIPSCFFRARQMQRLVCCCIFGCSMLHETVFVTDSYKKNFYCSGFFPFGFEFKLFDPVFISSRLQKPSIHHRVSVRVYVIESLYLCLQTRKFTTFSSTDDLSPVVCVFNCGVRANRTWNLVWFFVFGCHWLQGWKFSVPYYTAG